MERPRTTPDSVASSADQVEAEPILHPLPSRGRRAPVALAVAIAASLGILVWAPWGRSQSGISSASSASSGPTAGSSEERSAASQVLGVERRPSTAPSEPPAAVAVARYSSLVDNEWTVVALLSPNAAPSTEEPATQHASAPPVSPDGPFLVLQQGLTAVAAPVERVGHPDAPCLAPAGSRDRIAVRLPAGRVVYLGITFPGMDPRAEITASVLGRPWITLVRVSPIVVELEGMTAGRRYAMPASGSGGSILFGLTPAALMPSEAYRFAVTSPGLVGPRYLYACVGA